MDLNLWYGMTSLNNFRFVFRCLMIQKLTIVLQTIYFIRIICSHMRHRGFFFVLFLSHYFEKLFQKTKHFSPFSIMCWYEKTLCRLLSDKIFFIYSNLHENDKDGNDFVFNLMALGWFESTLWTHKVGAVNLYISVLSFLLEL